MKQAWDPVTLRVDFGVPLVSGDALITATGRKYLVLESTGKRLKCLVVPPEAAVPGRLIEWTWSKRRAVLRDRHL